MASIEIIKLTPNAVASMDNHRLSIAYDLFKHFDLLERQSTQITSPVYAAARDFICRRLAQPDAEKKLPTMDELTKPMEKMVADRTAESKRKWMKLLGLTNKPLQVFNVGEGVNVIFGEERRPGIVLAHCNQINGEAGYLVQFDEDSFAFAEPHEVEALPRNE